jgi:hypothetical protein
VQASKALRKTVGLGVDDEVDLALAVQRHGLVAVSGDRLEAHALEQRAHGRRVRRRVFDEFKAVGAHRVGPFSSGSGKGGVHWRLQKAMRNCRRTG